LTNSVLILSYLLAFIYSTGKRSRLYGPFYLGALLLYNRGVLVFYRGAPGSVVLDLRSISCYRR
jgi:hypothetical protein